MAQTSSPYATYYTYTTTTSTGGTPLYRVSQSHRRRASADYATYSRPSPPYTTHRYASADYSTQPEYVSPSSQRRAFYRQEPFDYNDTSESYRTSHGDSDDDEWIYAQDGKAYLIPGARRTRRAYQDTTYRMRQSTDEYFDQDVRYVDRYGNPVYMTNHARYDDPKPPKRRASTTNQQKRTSNGARPTTSSKSKRPAPPPQIRLPTEADARRYAIPAGYSLKNWDPDEEPLTLLGSVFDGNSLGKWIYDWTVYRHEAGTPISDMAGDLWLLLIALSGKVKRAEECVGKIRSKTNRDMVEDFIEGGQRLTDKIQALLKLCETPMLRTGKSRGNSGKPQLGKNAGVEFVNSIFGRDRYLHKTEKLMSSMRLWSLRFDANCEEILRNPRK